MVLSPIIGMPARKAAFNKEFLATFEEEHKKAYPEGSVDGMGQPDQGQGWYSKKLDLKSWIKFNSAQRILLNYIESFPIIIPAAMISGLYFPLYALIGIWGVVLGRIVFTIGYKVNPALRKPGMMLIMLCSMMMMFLSIATAVLFLLKTDAPEVTLDN
uniref:MAPEG family protein n=1 Tax=Strombidium inclinatum TaxID=197538 RepID=A0A7S3IJM8_9SPIT